MIPHHFQRLVLGLSITILGGSAVYAGWNADHHRGDLWYGKWFRDYGAFEFALIGDTPYGVEPQEDYPPFDRLVREINRDHHLTWVLHAGDIKAGSTECSDTMFADRFERYSRFTKPFILTPGDNEWTDCHRIAAGEYQPLERLARLREVFYPQPGVTLGRAMRVKSQAKNPAYEDFPENVRWSRNHVTFAAVHLVGSRNGLAPFAAGSAAVRGPENDAEVERRTQAALDWMAATFAEAGQRRSRGVFLMIHANPGLGINAGDDDRIGFESFLEALEDHVAEFDRPVVLAHGDSHYFRIDKPALGENGFMKNFTRVETFGSANVHWLRVKVDPASEEVFSFEQEVIEAN